MGGWNPNSQRPSLANSDMRNPNRVPRRSPLPHTESGNRIPHVGMNRLTSLIGPTDSGGKFSIKQERAVERLASPSTSSRSLLVDGFPASDHPQDTVPAAGMPWANDGDARGYGLRVASADDQADTCEDLNRRCAALVGTLQRQLIIGGDHPNERKMSASDEPSLPFTGSTKRASPL
jgi:hypothetical protein